MRRTPFDRWPHLRASHSGTSGGRAGGGSAANAPPSVAGPLAPPSSGGTTGSAGQADVYVGGSAQPLFLDDVQVEEGRNGQPASGAKFALLLQYANQLAYAGKPLFSFIGAKGATADNSQPWDDAEGTPLLRQIYGGGNYGAIKEGSAIHYLMSTRTGPIGLRFNDTSFSAAATAVTVGGNPIYPTDVATATLSSARGWVSGNSELAISAQALDPTIPPNRSGGILHSGVIWQEPQDLIDSALRGSFIDSSGPVSGKNAYINPDNMQSGSPIVGVRSAQPDSATALKQLRVSLLNTYQFRRGQIGWCAQAVESDSKFVDFTTSKTNFRYIFDQTYGGGGTSFAFTAPAISLPLAYSAGGLNTSVRCYVFVYARMSGATDTGSLGVANRASNGDMETSASALTNPITISGTTWKWYPDKLSATTVRFNPFTAPYFDGYAGSGATYDRIALCAKSSGATDTVQIAAFVIMPVGDGDFGFV